MATSTTLNMFMDMTSLLPLAWYSILTPVRGLLPSKAGLPQERSKVSVDLSVTWSSEAGSGGTGGRDVGTQWRRMTIVTVGCYDRAFPMTQ